MKEVLYTLKSLKTIIFLVTSYIVVSILSNIGSLRIVMLLGRSMDAGTLLFPLNFTLRDLIHKKAGKHIAIFTILLSSIINLVMFLFFYLVAIMPADLSAGAQLEFGKVLLPGIRIVIGSIVAMTLAEFLDTFVYTAVVKRLKEKYQWARVLISNLISVPLDSLVFVVIAFYGLMPMETLISIFISNVIIKYIVSVFSAGSIYLVKEKKANDFQ